MSYITYCGYVEILIMSLLLSLNILFLVIMILIRVFLLNISYYVSLKIYHLGVFGDLELSFSVWNLLFLILVLIIRCAVLFFSYSYLHRIRITNFIFLYLSFVLRIAWLILNSNFYWIMLGWDGLGVVSFLLIIYYRNLERISNGFFTLFQNRLGDLFFVLFLVGILNFSISVSVVKWGLIFLILGSTVKRAQYPFNAWLLAAISAPTPISSLVHSSTLVVAGVYILLQYRYCLADFLRTLKILRFLTLFFRSWGLFNELDIKKLIAFSTISHVSLMIFLLRQKLFKIAYFHLNIHAIFKSLIFIAFGFVILASFHAQDKRLVSYVNINPQLIIIYYFSCMCLAGLPFLTAFFSKDFIIEKIIENSNRFIDVFSLIIFLGIRIYYRLKLLKLNLPGFSQILCETQALGLISVFIIILINICLVNLYVRLVFRVSLELSSFKFFIYIFILIFLILSLCFNLNFKVVRYTKTLTILDLKFLNTYKIDVFMYFTIFDIVKLISSLSQIKLIILRNWWVIILLVYFI